MFKRQSFTMRQVMFSNQKVNFGSSKFITSNSITVLLILSTTVNFISGYPQHINPIDQYGYEDYHNSKSDIQENKAQLIELLGKLNSLGIFLDNNAFSNLNMRFQDDGTQEIDLESSKENLPFEFDDLVSIKTNSLVQKAKRKPTIGLWLNRESQSSTGELTDTVKLQSVPNKKLSKTNTKATEQQNTLAAQYVDNSNRMIPIEKLDTNNWKRMESSRWNNLRGMWGKRSLKANHS